MTFSFGLDVGTGDHECRIEGEGSLEDGRKIVVWGKVSPREQGLPALHYRRELNMRSGNRDRKKLIAGNLSLILADMALLSTGNPRGKITDDARENIRLWVNEVVY